MIPCHIIPMKHMMTPITKHLFRTPFGGTVEFSNLHGNNKMKNIIPNGREFTYEAYHAPAIHAGDQVRYIGTYASEKLGSYYRVLWKDGHLVLRRNRKPDLVLNPMAKDVFRTAEVDFRKISFQESTQGTFQVMEISSPVVKSMSFKRM